MAMNHHREEGFDGLGRRAEEQFDGRTQDGGELEASAPPLSELVHELEVHQVESEMQNEELRQSEERMEASEKKYADLYNFAPVGYFTLDRKGTILETNLTGANLLGVDRQRLIGKPFPAYCTPESADLLYLHLGRVLKTQQPAKCELTLKRPDGTLFEAQLESIAAKDAQGAVSLCYAVLSDITERKQAKAELDWVFEYSLDMLCVAGFDGYFKRVSPSFERTLGWSEAELLSRPLFDFIHPDDRETTFQAAAAHEGGKEAIHFENRYLCKDGSYKWISWNSHPIVEENRIIGVARDITERKRAEEAMQAHRQILETVTANLPAGTALIRDSDLRILLVNPAYQALVPGREMIGKTLEETWPETHPVFGERCHQVVASGKPYSAMDELFMIRRSPDGPLEPAYFSWSLIPVRLAGEDDWGLLSVCQETTDSVQAREALRDGRNQFQVLTQNLQCGVALVDEHGRFSIVNPAFLQMFDLPDGSEINNVNDRNWGEWQVFDEFGTLLAVDEHPVRKAALTGKAIRNMLVAVCSPGGRDLKWMMVSSEPILKSDGRLDALICTYYDITERKRAEKELFETNQRLNALMNALPVGVSFSDDATCQRITGNPAVLAQFAVRPEDNLSASAPDPTTPGRKVRFFREGREISDTELPLQHAVAGNREIAPMELEVVLPNGQRWFAEASGAPVRDEQGNVIGGVAVTVDITERKRAEEALRASQSEAERHAAELTALMDAVPAAIFIAHDVDCRQMSGSRATQELLGLPPTANFSKSAPPPEKPTHFLAVKDGREIPADQLPVQRAARGEEVRDYEFDLAFADGTVRTLVGDAVPLLDKSGAPRGAIGAFIEITARKRAEEALRNNEERLRLAAMAGGIAWWDWHIPTGETIWNEEHYRMMGYQPGTVQPGYQAWADRMHPEDREATEAILRRSLDQGGDYYTQFRSLWPDGSVRWIEARGRVERDSEGKPLRCYGVMLDTTERKEAEDALSTANTHLADADKRKDEFLAMLAHELRNPLAPVRNAVQVLRIAGPRDPVLMRQRDIIDRQVAHMARLLDDLLDVSRITRGKISLQLQQFHLVDVLVHAVETATPLIEARRHTLSLALPQDDLRIEADPDRLAQIVGNLLTNAARYTLDGGQIWLEAAREYAGSRENGDEVVIRVRDTGMGIAPEVLPRIFDLFAQADQGLAHSQGGLGIGLTMVKRLVEMHGGSVEAHSAGLGQGSEFMVRLRALPEEQVQQPPMPERTADRVGEALTRRILVVDDVVDACESLAELMGLWGHDVRTANDGVAALEAFREFQPEVVLLDIGMPCIDGYEVARRLRQEHKDRPLLLMALTGYAQESDRQLTQDAGFDHHLSKPVDLDALRDLLARVPD